MASELHQGRWTCHHTWALCTMTLNYVDVYRNKVIVQSNKFKVNFCCSLALLIQCPGNIRLVDSSATQRI